ncbi:MAG: glycerol-3-phosphate dehydrogenase [Parvularculaceae bacterium]
MAEVVDILVIGGGVNGAGIARDAAGRGYSVMLCEKGDLASATSSASTKLVHGGLRYLEHYEFRLVREALKERETLLKAAPHIIWPLRFVLPHHKGLRPRWMLRAGLFLYDHLGGREILPPTEGFPLKSDPRGAPLKPMFETAFEYSDCWVEDSRLVVLNAVDARERGASVLTRTEVRSVFRDGEVFRVEIADEGGPTRRVRARALVNAAGPWVDHVLRHVARLNAPPRFALRLVKGSHLIVDRLYDGDHAYIFQNADGRIIFAIPYERKFTLIGTTDLPYEGDPAAVAADASEIDYLCAAASEYFAKPVTPAMVRRTYAGVRPLHDDATNKDASAVTRDYVFDMEGSPPLLSVYGGKITTYRKLAEHALEKLGAVIGERGAAWTVHAPLPGGDIEDADFDRFFVGLGREFPWIETSALRRLARAYGTRVRRLIGDARSMSDMGAEYGAGLTDREIDYLRREEFARSADDVLWRRSKLELHLSDAVKSWLRERLP